jgi:hypothetical protein
LDLGEIITTPKNPNDDFTFNGQSLPFKIVDFWRWNQSDLIENRNRGILAEYIVRQALGNKYHTRLEWDTVDLKLENGITIEVKSAAYIQAWKQKKYSNISFDISKTKAWLAEEDRHADVAKRQSDYYIFCLLHHKDQNTIEPMNLEQWTFYIVPTLILNSILPDQKSIGLSTLEQIPNCKCGYLDLKNNLNKLITNS